MSKTKPTDEQIAEAKAAKAAKAAAKDAPKSDAKHLKETKPSVIRASSSAPVSTILAFEVASPRPMLTTTFSILGTAMTFL